jgi:hypothetical protein
MLNDSLVDTDGPPLCAVLGHKVGLDAASGTDQTGKRYWQRIEDRFCQLML